MFLSVLIELIFTVYCSFYIDLLAELMPVFYCKIYKIFFTVYSVFIETTTNIISGPIARIYFNSGFV